MKRVLIVDPIAPAGEELLARQGLEVVRASDSDPGTIRVLARDADGIITRSKIPDDIFSAAPRVRAVAIHGTGTDLVPLAEATPRGVLVSNIPGGNAQSVAEYAAMAMLMPQRIAAVVLNDVGPVVEPAGLERIRDYVGQGRSFSTWMHAARAVQEIQGHAFPDYEIADWLVAAKRTMTLGGNGRIVFDYDMKIAEPLAKMDLTSQPDLWPGIDALAGKPMLTIRGALSDLLSAETLEKMQQRLPGSEAVTIANVGHAPSLGEPEAIAAIDRLLARVG